LQLKAVCSMSALLRFGFGSGSLRSDWRGPVSGVVFRRAKPQDVAHGERRA
jgi:hypothetical protein